MISQIISLKLNLITTCEKKELNNGYLKEIVELSETVISMRNQARFSWRISNFRSSQNFQQCDNPDKKNKKKKKIQKKTENKITNMKVRLSWLDNKGEASIKIK